MAVNARRIRCEPETVFRVLADGWLYPSWVVGASRVREVDDSWPDQGASIRHSFGVWPWLLDDATYIVEWDPPRHARMRARGWPIGEAYVVLDVRPAEGGCVVRIEEDAAIGPGRLVPRVIRDLGLGLRNVETLRRLAFLAEGGAR